MQSEHWVVAIGEAVQELGESLQGYMRAIENVFVYADEVREGIEKGNLMRSSWHAPRKIVLQDQVMNRKPRLARARTNC